MASLPGKFDTAVAALATGLLAVAGVTSATLGRFPIAADPEILFGSQDTWPTDASTLVAVIDGGPIRELEPDKRARGEVKRDQVVTVKVLLWCYARPLSALSPAFVTARRQALNVIETVRLANTFDKGSWEFDWTGTGPLPGRLGQTPYSYTGTSIDVEVRFFE